MKKKISKYIPFIFMGIVLLLFHKGIIINIGDDVEFRRKATQSGFNLIQWLIKRYRTWSSRTLIEMLMMIILTFPGKVWKVLDSVIFTIIPLFMSKTLFSEEDIIQKNWILVSLCLTLNMNFMKEAGWVATTMNYAWPLAFGMIALYSIRKKFEDKKIYLIEAIGYSICLLISANSEQMCVVICIAFFVASVIYWGKNKKIEKYFAVELVLSALSLAYIMLCPGNTIRTYTETKNWLPGFERCGLLKKIELGISNTLNVILIQRYWWLVILAMFLCIAIWYKYNDKFYRTIAAIPLIVTTLLQYFHEKKGNTCLPYNLMNGKGIFRPDTIRSWKAMWIYVGLLFVCCLFLINMYILYENSIKMLLISCIFVVGLMTKAMMGFSPTIWASMERTGCILIYAIIACCALIIEDWNFKDDKATISLYMIAIPCGAIGIANLYYFFM